VNARVSGEVPHVTPPMCTPEFIAAYPLSTGVNGTKGIESLWPSKMPGTLTGTLGEGRTASAMPSEPSKFLRDSGLLNNAICGVA
jgi:hypothetical protein